MTKCLVEVIIIECTLEMEHVSHVFEFSAVPIAGEMRKKNSAHSTYLCHFESRFDIRDFVQFSLFLLLFFFALFFFLT